MDKEILEQMEFPKTLDEFIKQYSFIDDEEVYTNGSELIPTFRVKQWEEHKEEENTNLKQALNEIREYVGSVILGELENGNTYYLKDDEVGKDILQIIDKALGGNNENN